MSSIRTWTDKKVLILGLGTHGGGEAAARFFSERGARVRVTDLKSEAELAEPLERLADLPIRYTLGRHRDEEILEADLIVKNPAVPFRAHHLRLGREAGIAITTEMALFLASCPAPVCGVTGTNGKTTTSRLIAHLLQSCGERVRLAGNMGVSLLGELDSISPDERIVLELSSFQLQDLARTNPDVLRPAVGVVTNLSPNHLNMHADFDEYARAKGFLVERTPADGAVVLNRDDARVRAYADRARCDPFFFSTRESVPRGAWLTPEGRALFRPGPGASPRLLFEAGDLPLPGTHNLTNALAAALAAHRMGGAIEALAEGFQSFSGVSGRLTPVPGSDDRRYVNDTASTTPASAMAGIRSFPRGLTLICGGSDKGMSYGELGRVIARRVACLITVGQTGPRIEQAVREACRSGEEMPLFHRASSMEEAVRRAREETPTGGTILLSPACASFDMFENAEDRGRQFERAVRTQTGRLR